MWYIFLHYYCLLLGKNCHHTQRLTPPAHISVEGICFKQFSKIERILKFGQKCYFICNSTKFLVPSYLLRKGNEWSKLW